MATLADAKRTLCWRRLWCLLVIAFLLWLIGVLTGPKLGALHAALSPPLLPPLPKVTEQVWRGDQNWKAEQAEQFHFTSQGTRTLPLPLSWFLALEAPLDSPYAVPFAKRERFADPDYLLRFGFVPASKSAFNPHGLPVGLAESPLQNIQGIAQKETAIGFTCAACHTGQLVYGGKRYVIDGGPATTDLGQLTRALGAALGQTVLSEKLPILNGRFTRFAKAVLGDQYSDATRIQLAAELESVVGVLRDIPGGIDVTEGFTRLDALNRIGNQVFALDVHRYDNYVDINAPVNYPHIWTSSWFNWVQYDGSIMQPLVRNVGEAMGVSADLVFDVPKSEGRFSSSIPLDNLHWIERQLAGPEEPLQAKAFTGLNAPTWPESFPALDQDKVAQGAALYEKRCAGCHRPALTPEIAQGKSPDAKFWNYFSPISWEHDGKTLTTSESLLKVKIIPQSHVGTDPAQGNVLQFRTVDTAGSVATPTQPATEGLGVDIDVCVRGENGLTTARVTDAPLQSYALALGAVVQLGIDQGLDLMHASDATRAEFEGDRPNCLQAGAGYKARPLNGVWATAPFLHNGSVPTIYDLLSPVAERPRAFLLGDITFDPVKLGLKTQVVRPDGRDYDAQGYFILDTARPGNHNTGHEFSNDEREGVIGPALSPDERNAIVEFLKSI